MRYLLIVICLFSFQLQAGTERKFHLIFSNGMKNTAQDAMYSAQSLKLSIVKAAQQLPKNKKLLWKQTHTSLAYNFDDTTVREIKEVYQQKKNESDRNFWKWYQSATDQDEDFKKMVYEEMSQCRLEHRIDETLWNQREIYLKELQNDFDLLVVAHSQGNLFANALYDRIELDEPKFAQRIHLVAVATPASMVADGGPHFTLKSDGVINDLLPMLLKDGLLPPLKPNIENKKPKPGLMDHEFIKHYLLGEPSGDKIVSSVLSKITL